MDINKVDLHKLKNGRRFFQAGIAENMQNKLLTQMDWN
jgi:hypothetical protein